MPVYIFSCEEGHVVEKFRHKAYKNKVKFRCKTCGLYMRRDYTREHSRANRAELNIDRNQEPISHLLGKRGTTGVWVEHLTPEPVYVKDKKAYSELLKRTSSREKQTGYAG